MTHTAYTIPPQTTTAINVPINLSSSRISPPFFLTHDNAGPQEPEPTVRFNRRFIHSHALSVLSIPRVSRRRDLNPRPSVYKTLALPLSYAGRRGLHSHALGVLRIPRDKTAALPLLYRL